MDDRLSYRDVRAIERHYCRENDNIVGFFGGIEAEPGERSSDGDD